MVEDQDIYIFYLELNADPIKPLRGGSGDITVDISSTNILNCIRYLDLKVIINKYMSFFLNSVSGETRI